MDGLYGDKRVRDTYDLIRILQNVSYMKYDSYAHVAGWLGSVLDDAIFRLPKKQQEYFKERLQNAIDDIVRSE